MLRVLRRSGSASRAAAVSMGLAAVYGGVTATLTFCDSAVSSDGNTAPKRLLLMRNLHGIGSWTQTRSRVGVDDGKVPALVLRCAIFDEKEMRSSVVAAAKEQGAYVMTFGLNLIGQLGNGHDRPMAAPSRVPDLDGIKVVRIALGDSANAALTEDGSVYMWGSGAYGRLGHGDESSLNLPRKNELLMGTRIVDVSVGGFHMVALDDEGGVYSWGRGAAAGHGSYDTVFVPKKLDALASIKCVAISAGRLHSAAVGEDGSVWTWGNNFEGELGHGDKKNCPQPTCIQALKGRRAVDVACGRDFTVVLLDDGSLYACGADDYGQLGLGRGHGERYVQVPKKVVGGLAEVRQIAAGDCHSCAVTQSGSVYTWGMGRDGQLGHGEKTDQAIPTTVEALKDVEISQVACGGGHTGAVTRTGSLYLWGRGRDGQLGREGELESIAAYRTTPQRVERLQDSVVLQIALGADHSAVLVRQR